MAPQKTEERERNKLKVTRESLVFEVVYAGKLRRVRWLCTGQWNGLARFVKRL